TRIIHMRTNEQMFTDIAHEGGHGWAAINGLDSYDNWRTGTKSLDWVDRRGYEYYKDDYYDVFANERVAMHFENLVKAEHGLDIQQAYYYDEEAAPQGPAVIPGTSTSTCDNSVDFSTIPVVK